MAEFFDALEEAHVSFIQAQPLFFTATACAEGRINLSPKGLDSFRVLSPKRVGYLDYNGSGNETAAHLKHDGRITLMFNSFTRNALILRLYGRGRVVRPQHEAYRDLRASFPEDVEARQVMLIDIESVQTSCGYGVPEMTLVGPRDTLSKWAASKGAEGLAAYQREKNMTSIDGFETGLLDGGEAAEGAR